MGQYSPHRRPNAVPKVERVQRDDPMGKDELRLQEGFGKAIERTVPKPAPKRSFAELMKQPKKK